jgi:hypothetical protein
MEWGAGGAAPLLVAPQPRMGSGGEEIQDMGMVATERGAGRAAPLPGAPQPSVGLRDDQDQRGTRGNALESKGNACPAKPVVAHPPAAPQPQEVHPLTVRHHHTDMRI